MEEDNSSIVGCEDVPIDDFDSIEPLPEKKDFGITIIECIQEDSNYQSESDNVDDQDLEDIVYEDDDSKSESNPILLDDNSLLEKFLYKRSPKKLEKNSIGQQKVVDMKEEQVNKKSEETLEKDEITIQDSKIVSDEPAPDSIRPEISERPIEENSDEEKQSEKECRWINPISKVVVCATGFSNENKNKIEELVQKLGGMFKYDYTSNVTVLITKDNKSEKYKFARKTGTYTVTGQWIRDCHDKGYFVNPSDYLFPPFNNNKFYFHNCDTIEQKSIIKKHQGEILDEIDSSQAKGSYIVIPSEDVERSISKLELDFSFFIDLFKKDELNLVTIPWIDAYLNKQYDILDNYVILYK